MPLLIGRVLSGLRHLRGFLLELRYLFVRIDELRRHAERSLDLLTRVLTRIDQVELAIAARFDQMVAEHMQLMRRIEEEIDRLDSYLVHHATMLRSDLAQTHGDLREHATMLRSDLAQTHGDLREHATALRQRIDAAQNAVQSLHGPMLSFARTSERAYVAERMDVLLIGSSFDLIVPTHEAGLIAYLFRHGVEAIEPGVRVIIHDHLKPGAVVVDAGANIGIHALTMARAVGEDGRVFCFEPLPDLAQVLLRTLRLNGFGNRAHVEQVALADAPGETILNRAEHGPMSSLYALPDSMGADTIPVRLISLDSYFAPASQVDFVKIDVEGAEPRVWRGMQRVLAENPRIEIILEWCASHFRRSGEDPDRFMMEIRAAGFTPFIIDHDGSLHPLTHLGEGGGFLEACNLLLTRSSDEVQTPGNKAKR